MKGGTVVVKLIIAISLIVAVIGLEMISEARRWSRGRKDDNPEEAEGS
jgi:hypothetical protein